MIYLKEKATRKLPGLSSIYLTSLYDPNIVDIVKTCSERNWNQETKEWELPIYELGSLINRLIDIDNIELTIQKDKKQTVLTIPKGYKFKLPPYIYQIDGIEYGLNKQGWILGDDQGLGKTFQMIHLAGILKQTEGLKHCLVLCGKSDLKYNWAKDIEKLSSLSYHILGEKEKRNGEKYIGSVADRLADLKSNIKEFFIITNIETLRDNKIAEAIIKNKLNIDMIVLDEAHVCKSPTSQQGKNLLKLKKFKRKIALSGTIILNSPLDAYVPLKWTDNESATYTYFKSRYCVYDDFRRGLVLSYKNLDLLQKQLSGCMLRRTKDEVLDLPPKTYSYDYVELTDKQKIVYENMKDSIRDEIDRLPLPGLNQMALAMRLRQVTSFAGIASSTIPDTAKLNRLEDDLEMITAQGDKALVFTCFKETANEIERRFAKYNTLKLTGDITDDYQVNEIKRKFQEDPAYKVLVGTWQKLGTGHNLTAGTYVLFIDTPWTDGDAQQCVDRAYRIGTTKHVFVKTYITKGTFDERVKEIVEGKSDMFHYLVQSPNNKAELKTFLGL